MAKELFPYNPVGDAEIIARQAAKAADELTAAGDIENAHLALNIAVHFTAAAIQAAVDLTAAALKLGVNATAAKIRRGKK